MKRVQLCRLPGPAFRLFEQRQGGDHPAQPARSQNPLTFDSYGELRDLFREMATPPTSRPSSSPARGGNFCSGGDVHEIIGPLVKMDMPGCSSSRA